MIKKVFNWISEWHITIYKVDIAYKDPEDIMDIQFLYEMYFLTERGVKRYRERYESQLREEDLYIVSVGGEPLWLW